MHIVVIGNGIAGVSAAGAARHFDKCAQITILSEEPHAAYSACVLPDYLSGRIPRGKVFIKSPGDYAHGNIRLQISSVTAIDFNEKKLVLDTGDIFYDKLVIATGSKPFIPQITGMGKQGVFTLKTLDDADKINAWQGRSAVVAGSGPVGIEASIALKALEYRTLLIGSRAQILPHTFDAQPAFLIREILERKGIQVSTAERVLEIGGERVVQEVVTNSRNVPCDTVLMVTGMRPDVKIADGLLELGDGGGIRVDDGMMTSVPDIYACGDCVEAKGILGGKPVLSLLWHNARRQGRVAGANAAGFPKRYSGSLDVTGIDLFGVHAVSIGKTSTGLPEEPEVIETQVDDRYRRLIFSGNSLVGVQAINWTRDMGALMASVVRGDDIKNFKESRQPGRPRFASYRSFPFDGKTNRR